MTPSSYQVERLLEHLRRLGDWLAWPAFPRVGGGDPVRMSRAGVRAAREAEPVPPAARRGPRPPSLAAVRDAQRYAPVVEAERERRAGSFMRPPYPDEPPPTRIPKLAAQAAPKAGRRRKPRRVNEAD
jgi:hypothetical protein